MFMYMTNRNDIGNACQRQTGTENELTKDMMRDFSAMLPRYSTRGRPA